MVTSEQKEQCVNYVKERYTVSHARACRLFNSSRLNIYYDKKMPKKDAPVKDAIFEAINKRKRGRKKVIAIVQRKHDFSSSRIRRVYEQSGLALPCKPKKRNIYGVRRPIERTLKLNQEWAIDFMSDSLADGRRIRVLTVIDHFNLSCKGIYIKHSMTARGVIHILEELFESHGKPLRVRTDNGPEFISKYFRKWMKNNEVTCIRIQPGKPQQNAIIERFNRTVREDLLDPNLFFSLEHASELAHEFVYDYNHHRPHESLSNKTPIEYVA